MSERADIAALVDRLIETAMQWGWEADMGTGADTAEVYAEMQSARSDLERAISSKPRSDRMAVGE